MKTKKILLITALALLAGTSAKAAFRTWTVDGKHEYKAELVAFDGARVKLRNAKGRTAFVQAEMLSAADREYLHTALPPQLSLKVTRHLIRNDLASYSPGVEEELVSLEVSISKTSRPPFTGELTAVALTIARDISTDEYVVATRSDEQFSFKGGNRYGFTGDQARLRNYKSSARIGGEYVGYLVAVFGPDGTLLEADGSRTAFEKLADPLAKMEAGMVFDRTGAVLDTHRTAAITTVNTHQAILSLMGE